MNKSLFYKGGVVDLVDALSTIQDTAEQYIGNIVSGIAPGSGLMYPSSVYPSTIPAQLYIDGSYLKMSVTGGPVRFIFSGTPTNVVTVSTTQTIGYFSTPTVLHSYCVYATVNQVESGPPVQIINKSVLSNSDSLLPIQEDNITFTVVDVDNEAVHFVIGDTIPSTPPGILVGIVYLDNSTTLVEGMTRTNGIVFDMRPGISRDIVLPGILPKFQDRYLELNSALTNLHTAGKTAGINVKLDSSLVAQLLMTYDTSYRWVTNYPISGPVPLADNDYTTKKWVIDYINNLLVDVPTPLNFRYTSVTGAATRVLVDDSMKPLISGHYQVAGAWTGSSTIGYRADVLFQWGYEDLILYVYTNSPIVTIVSGGPAGLSTNDLQGYYVWIPDLSGNYRIVTNTSNTLTLENEDGTAFNPSTSFTIANYDSKKAWIHCNADKYTVTAVPMIGGEPVPERVETSEQTFAQSPVRQQKILTLTLGINYSYNVAAFRGSNSSEVVPMPDSPKILSIPFLNSGGATDGVVSVTSTGNGFEVSVTGWATADGFEIVWTTDNGGADFTSNQQQHMYTTSRTIDITTSSMASYFVKVRPLICGQQIVSNAELMRVHNDGGGNILTFKGIMVISGSSGLLPQDTLLLSNYVNFDSYIGTFTYAPTTGDSSFSSWTITLTDLQRMSDVGNDAVIYLDHFPNELIGNIISIGGFTSGVSGSTYIVSHTAGITSGVGGRAIVTLVLSKRTVTTGPPPTSGTLYINMFKDSKVVVKQTLTADFQLSKIDIDCDVLRTVFESDGTTTRTIMARAYQMGRESQADWIIIDKTDMQFSCPADTIVSGAFGPRTLVVDLYDTTDPSNSAHKNEAGISGRVSIYGRPVALTAVSQLNALA